MYTFSIILPTKNRPQKTMRAIRSVLEQGRNDVQIVVVDNSDTDDLRQEVDALENNDIYFLKTGGLSSSENWVAATPHCKGEYYIYLLDREIFLPGTLDRFADFSKKYPGLPICWQEALPIGTPSEHQDEYVLTSGEVLCGLIQAACGMKSNIEMRSHTICYPKQIYTAILDKLDGNIITVQASDLAAPIQMVFLIEKCVYIPECIKRTSLSSSQTVRGMLFWQDALNDMHLSVDETFNFVPIKFYFILNHILNGILDLCKKNGYDVVLEGEILECYFLHIYHSYMRAVQKYHLPADEFMKQFFNSAVKCNMGNKKWFNEIFYFWNWPDWYTGE